MKTLYLYIIIILSVCKGFSQNKSEELIYASSSILINGLKTAILAKDKKNFWKNFGKGALGGACYYGSKKILSENLDGTIYTKIPSNISYTNNNNFAMYAWGARILNDAGYSIIENTIDHKPIFSRYFLHFAFMEFEFSEESKVRIMPVSATCFLTMALSHKLLIAETFENGGIPIFELKNNKNYFGPGSQAGFALGNNIALYSKNLDRNDYHIHEIIHTYQFLEYNNPGFRLNLKSNIFKSDLNIFPGIYTLVNAGLGYENNPFEIEADYFAH